jgi:hypothetical protein
MTKQSAVFVSPPEHLARLMRRPGGITKEKAVARAKAAVEKMRVELSAVLSRDIDWLDREALRQNHLSKSSLGQMRRRAAAIYNLAGTYGYSRLQQVAVSLLDCLEAMRERKLSCAAPVTVHTRAARLLAPGSTVPDEAAVLMLENLQQVVSHLRLQDPCSSENCPNCPVPAAQA